MQLAPKAMARTKEFLSILNLLLDAGRTFLGYLVLMIPLSKPLDSEIVYKNLNIQQDIAWNIHESAAHKNKLKDILGKAEISGSKELPTTKSCFAQISFSLMFLKIIPTEYPSLLISDYNSNTGVSLVLGFMDISCFSFGWFIRVCLGFREETGKGLAIMGILRKFHKKLHFISFSIGV